LPAFEPLLAPIRATACLQAVLRDDVNLPTHVPSFSTRYEAICRDERFSNSTAFDIAAPVHGSIRSGEAPRTEPSRTFPTRHRTNARRRACATEEASRTFRVSGMIGSVRYTVITNPLRTALQPGLQRLPAAVTCMLLPSLL
jgi:hypothetical protein